MPITTEQKNFLKSNACYLRYEDPGKECFPPTIDRPEGKIKTIGELATPAKLKFRDVAEYYKRKYGFEIKVATLSELKDSDFSAIQEALEQSKTENTIIPFLLFDDQEGREHATPLLIHEGKILFPLEHVDLGDYETPTSDEAVIDYFPKECFRADPDVYNAEDGKTYHPQASFAGCDVFALKIIKLFMTGKVNISDSHIDKKNKQFYPPPSTYRYGQSSKFFNRYKKSFSEKTGKSENFDVDDFQRRKYGKNTLIYFAAKRSFDREREKIIDRIKRVKEK